MNPILYAIIGALSSGLFLAALAGAVWVAHKAWRAWVALDDSLQSIATGLHGLMESQQKMTAGLLEVQELLRKTSTELTLLRSIMEAAATPNFGVDPAQPGAEAPPPRRMPAGAAFPNLEWGNFTPVTTEAEVADTDIIETSDAELVEAEAMEHIRDLGYAVEAEDAPPEGVTGQA